LVLEAARSRWLRKRLRNGVRVMRIQAAGRGPVLYRDEEEALYEGFLAGYKFC